MSAPTAMIPDYPRLPGGERIVRLALTAFTARGAALAQALAEKLTGLGNRCMIAVPARLNLAVPTYENLGAWTGERFADCEESSSSVPAALRSGPLLPM
ncbi:MAG: hypothetical protein ACLSAF_16500 [Intestinimonas sp.]